MSEPLSTCPACKGSGRNAPYRYADNCPYCSGKGRVSGRQAHLIREEFSRDLGKSVEELQREGWIL